MDITHSINKVAMLVTNTSFILQVNLFYIDFLVLAHSSWGNFLRVPAAPYYVEHKNYWQVCRLYAVTYWKH